MTFKVGIIFDSGKQFKDCVTKYAITNGYNIRWSRMNKLKMEARCKGSCPWVIYASQPKGERTFIVKKYSANPCCYRTLTNKLATLDWLA